MRRAFLLVVFGATMVGGGSMDPPPVSVELTAPANGSTVSGVIQLTATASSTIGPIVRVEFFRDGVLIGTVYNPALSNTPPGLMLAR